MPFSFDFDLDFDAEAIDQDADVTNTLADSGADSLKAHDRVPLDITALQEGMEEDSTKMLGRYFYYNRVTLKIQRRTKVYLHCCTRSQLTVN